MSETFHFFWGGPFSQFAVSPFTLDGERFRTAEHYMMWRKARLFGADDIARAILATRDPGVAKGLGRRVPRFNQQVWDREKRAVVTAGSEAKYRRNTDFRARLFNTAPATLVEASPQDAIWGIGLSACDPRAGDRATWMGLNLLGEILTETRDRLMAEARGLAE